MLTIAEVEKFTKMLDYEYENEIVLLIKRSQDAIDGLLKTISSKEFNDSRNRCGYGEFKFGHLPIDIQYAIKTFRYSEDVTNHRIYKNSIPSNLISWFGYSPTAYSINDGLMSVFYRADAYRGNLAKMVQDITSLKKCFNNIKKTYNEFFYENDGEMFKRMASKIMAHYNTVMQKDGELDSELFKLFNTMENVKRINITITIEEV